MASVRKHKSGWRAEVARRGVRRSRVFPTKTAAKDWATREEHLILNGEGRYGPGTVGDLLLRYAREVSPAKRGARAEMIRLERIARDRLGALSLRKLSPADIADWRDRMLRTLAPGTVYREMNTLSAVFTVAWKEWGLLPSHPMRDVKRPAQPPARNRRVTDTEISRLLERAPDIATKRGRAIHAFRFAVETGMRAGEICGLRAGDIEGSVAHLPMTKNGEPRDVPLSSRARALLAELPPVKPGQRLFALEPKTLDVLFRRVRDEAEIEGLTFHDSRGEAATRLSKRVDALELARILGHRDLKMTLRYYKATAAEIAGRLG